MKKIINRVVRVFMRKIKSRYELHYLKEIRKTKITKDTVLIESTHGRDFSGHVLYITKYLTDNYPNLKVKIAINEKKLEWVKNLCDRHNIVNVNFVKYLSKEYVQALANSEYLVNDTTFWSFFNKQPEQKYINIWHGTPLKCLGKDNELDGFGNVQKNFLSANYLIFSNDYTKDKIINSYNLNGIASAEIVIGPSPRNSVLYSSSIRKSIRNELEARDKKIYLYMPTYRDAGTSVHEIEDFLQTMEENLSEDELLFVKLHPFDVEKIALNLNEMNKIKPFPEKYETYEFLTSVDTLITDYSSIMYDFLCTGRDILLYTYDKEAYYEMRGLYEDIDDYPIPQFQTPYEILMALHNDEKNLDTFALKEFSEKYISHDNADGTAQLIDFIFNKKKSNNIKKFSIRNEKENIVFYAGALWDNGITSAFLNTLDSIDLSEKNYILYLVDRSVKPEHKYKLQELKIPYILSSGTAQYRLVEGTMAFLYLNTEFFGRKIFRNVIENKIFSMYRLDFRRMYNSLDINQYIHYTGFERSLGAMLSAISGGDIRTTAFYHTDMFEEYKAKKNLNIKTLTSMYRHIDQLVLVNRELEPTLLEHCPNLDNIIVLDNFIGYKKIQYKSKINIFSTLLGVPVQYGTSNVKLEFVQNNSIGKNRIFQNIEEYLKKNNYVIVKQDNEHSQIVLSKENIWQYFDTVILKLIDALLNPDMKVFINIGRFDIQKGHQRLIKAFKQVNLKYPNTLLVIIAPHGPLKEDTIRWVNEAEMNDSIIILGGMSNPYTLLKLSDAFVFSSLYEGLGLVVFEALAVGTDVITVDIPATTEGLKYGSADPDYLPALITENSQRGLTEGWLRYMQGNIKYGQYDFDKGEQKSLEIWNLIVN